MAGQNAKHRVRDYAITPAQLAVAKLCDGTLTMKEVGERLGISLPAAFNRRLHAARKLGRELPVKPWRHVAAPEPPELIPATRAGCGRCGLTGMHECLPGSAVDMMWSGTSNLGSASDRKGRAGLRELWTGAEDGDPVIARKRRQRREELRGRGFNTATGLTPSDVRDYKRRGLAIDRKGLERG